MKDNAKNYVKYFKVQDVIDIILYIIIVVVKLLRRKEGNWGQEVRGHGHSYKFKRISSFDAITFGALQDDPLSRAH